MAIKRNTPEGNHTMLVQAEPQNGLTSSSLHEQLGEIGTSLALKTVETDLANYTKTLGVADVIAKGPWVDVRAFGAAGDGVTDDIVGITAAFNHCLASGKSLYFPAGTYNVVGANYPFRQNTTEITELMDCKNVVVFGDGASTVLKTTSSGGADVLQINGIKNLHFRNIGITATLTGTSGAGSNGVSVTNGWDNLTFDNIWIFNLPYIDKTTYLDGGKGLTVQPGTPIAECGTISAKNIFIKGCVFGADLEVDLANFMSKKSSINIDTVVEDCYMGVSCVAGASAGAISDGDSVGLNMRATCINCQHDVVLNRAHGVDFNVNVVTTKSAAARRLNPSGTAWTTDTIVDAMSTYYAANSRLSIFGYKGECDYKARIGGATSGSAGAVFGPTYDCTILLDIGGSAATADVAAINAGGSILTKSTLCVSNATATTLPTDFYSPSQGNTIIIGATQRISDLLIGGALRFAYTDGMTSYHQIRQSDGELIVQQTLGSTPSLSVLSMYNSAGSPVFKIRNDGCISTNGRSVATSVSTVKSVLPIYDAANTLVGYVPIYTTYE